MTPIGGGAILPRYGEVSNGFEKASQTKITNFQKEANKFGHRRDQDLWHVPPATLRRMYRFNPIVRAAVDTIINEIISAKWQISPIDLEEENTLELKDKIKEIEFFFRHPNTNKENFKTLLRKVALDLLLLDAGVIEKVRSRDEEKIAEIYAVDGATIQIKTDEFGSIENYYQVLDDKQTEALKFEKDQLIYIQHWARNDSVYGLPPLETLHNCVTAFLYGENYNLRFFENNATPKGIIDLGGSVPERELDRFRQYWEAEQQQKPHRIMILGNIGTPDKPGSGIKWIPIAMQPKDYDLAKYLEWLMKIILMVFGVSPSKVGWTEEVRGAPATGQILQSQAFKERAIYPMMEKMAWYLTEEIVHGEFKANKLQFEFVEEFSLQDKLLKAQIHQYEIMGQWKTVEEIRKEEGLETASGGMNEEGFNNDPENNRSKWQEILAGLGRQPEEDKELEKKRLFDELNESVRQHISLNSKNSQNEIKDTFRQLEDDVRKYIGKSIKDEIKKAFKKKQK